MRFIILVLLTVWLAPAAPAAELVMFEQKGCVWCQRFDRDIAPAYDKSTEGKRAPLRRVDIARPNPADLVFIKRERFTPVFVLVENGKEYGRIRGYPGDTFFWGLLATLIGRLDRGEAAPADPPSAAVPPGVTVGE